jgi:hypothetical protein
MSAFEAFVNQEPNYQQPPNPVLKVIIDLAVSIDDDAFEIVFDKVVEAKSVSQRKIFFLVTFCVT